MDDVTVEPAGRALAGVPRERLAELVAATYDAMSGVIERYGVSEDEWYAALTFLGEVAAADEMILLSDVMRLSVLVNDLTHPPDGAATAANVLGPFWRPAPEIGNPGTLVGDDEPGERLVMTGVVRAGVRWARLGRHAYRPPNIHLRRGARANEPLTTMVFFAGDDWLGNDTIG